MRQELDTVAARAEAFDFGQEAVALLEDSLKGDEWFRISAVVHAHLAFCSSCYAESYKSNANYDINIRVLQ